MIVLVSFAYVFHSDRHISSPHWFNILPPNAAVRPFSGIAGRLAQLPFDLKQAVVLGQSFRTAGGAGLDHAGQPPHAEVGNAGVFGLAAPVGDHGGKSRFLSHFDGGQGLADAADLVQFYEYRVETVLTDAAFDEFRIGDGQIVGSDLDFSAEPGMESRPVRACTPESPRCCRHVRRH